MSDYLRHIRNDNKPIAIYHWRGDFRKTCTASVLLKQVCALCQFISYGVRCACSISMFLPPSLFIEFWVLPFASPLPVGYCWMFSYVFTSWAFGAFSICILYAKEEWDWSLSVTPDHLTLFSRFLASWQDKYLIGNRNHQLRGLRGVRTRAIYQALEGIARRFRSK